MILEYLTIGALGATIVTSSISAMTGWWNWRHLKEINRDITVLKAQALRQLSRSDQADAIHDQAKAYQEGTKP